MTERGSLRDEAQQMFNSIGICGDGHTIGRLVGFHEDALDYYYRIRFTGDRAESCWSCCGWFIPLKGVIPERAYAFLEHVFGLNGCPPAASFNSTVSSREEDIATYGERIVDRYRDNGEQTR